VISANNANSVGLKLNDISTFFGSVTNGNTGTIRASASGITVTTMSSFTGGIGNGGSIAAGNVGIFLAALSTFAGGISNSGVITAKTGHPDKHHGRPRLPVERILSRTGAVLERELNQHYRTCVAGRHRASGVRAGELHGAQLRYSSFSRPRRRLRRGDQQHPGLFGQPELYADRRAAQSHRTARGQCGGRPQPEPASRRRRDQHHFQQWGHGAGRLLRPVRPLRRQARECALALDSGRSRAHDWITDPTLEAAFQALPGASFIVNGATQPKDSALVSAGSELRFGNGVSFLGKFEGELAGRSHTYAGTGTVRKIW
jgi:hypothetical protein